MFMLQKNIRGIMSILQKTWGIMFTYTKMSRGVRRGGGGGGGIVLH